LFKQFSFLLFLNVAKDLELLGKCFTSFNEFQIFGVAWLSALNENLVHTACDTKERRRKKEVEKEHSGGTGL